MRNSEQAQQSRRNALAAWFSSAEPVGGGVQSVSAPKSYLGGTTGSFF